MICTPSDENEARHLLTTAYLHKGPASVRYPRGIGPNKKINEDLDPFDIGKAKLIVKGNPKIIILNFGALIEEAKEVANTLELTLIDMRFVKPIDEEILKEYLSNADWFITIEDGSVMGGAGSSVQEFCSKEEIDIKSILFGIPDKFIEHASREQMIEDAGLSANKIKSKLKKLL
tara:strand:- start:1123 stop:1647 length:525 start_codon:yes stop_codon:yes gene_type:complete